MQGFWSRFSGPIRGIVRGRDAAVEAYSNCLFFRYV
jgi:hypothetical protein